MRDLKTIICVVLYYLAIADAAQRQRANTVHTIFSHAKTFAQTLYAQIVLPPLPLYLSISLCPIL